MRNKIKKIEKSKLHFEKSILKITYSLLISRDAIENFQWDSSDRELIEWSILITKWDLNLS
jgi:hypothetical protein